jgi:hypothetical protein
MSSDEDYPSKPYPKIISKNQHRECIRVISQKIFVPSKNGPIPDLGFLIAQNEKIYIPRTWTLHL